MEWFFSRLKRTFRKLDHEWRDARHSISTLFFACCLLMNFLAEIRNLYPINDINVDDMPVGPDDHIPLNENLGDDLEIDIEEKYNV